MALEYVGTFVLTDESLDRHSERIIVRGVDLAPFKKNPIMLYNHIRTIAGWWGGEGISEDSILPIGRWENVKKVGNTQIEADAYIDMDDEFAAKVGAKVKSGILNAVSIGFKALAYSDAEEDKVLGQKGLTITKAELMEASLVDIPANPNATVVAKVLHEKSAAAKPGEAEEIYFVKTFHKKDNRMENNMFDAVKAFVKKAFGKDVASEEDALKALQEGAENPNLSLDAVKAAMQSEIEAVVKAATDALRAETNASILTLTKTVGDLTEALETMSAGPDTVEEATEQIDELKAQMDALSHRIASMQTKKSGITAKVDGVPAKGETPAEKEKREELNIVQIVKSQMNGALKN